MKNPAGTRLVKEHLRFFRRALCVGLLVLACPALAAARLEYRLGASADLIYDDNVFLTERDEQDDYIAHLTPSLGIRYRRPRLVLDADYSHRYIFYRDNSELDKKDLNEVQRLLANLDAGDFRGFTLGVSDELIRVNIDTRVSESVDKVSVNSANRNTFIIAPGYKLKLAGSQQFELKYEYTSVTYHDVSAEGEPDDRWSHAGLASYTIGLSRALEADVEVGVERTEATTSADNKQYSLMAGAKWEPGSRSSLTVKAGGARSDFEGFDTEDSFLWFANLTVEPVKRTTISATSQRILAHGEIDGAYNDTRHSFSALYESARLSAEAELYYNVKDFLTNPREDRTTGVNLTADYSLTERLTASVSGSWSSIELDGTTESDRDRYEAGLGLGYQRKLLGLRANYKHRRDDAEDAGEGYTSNIYSVGVSVGY